MKKTVNPMLLRVKLLLNQEEFADYLGVTRSLLSLHEKDLRSLPSSVYGKLARLEQMHYHLYKDTAEAAVHPAIQKRREKEKKTMKSQATFCLQKKIMAERKLATMRENQAKLQLWSKLIENYLNNTPKLKENEDDHVWFEFQNHKLLKKMTRCDEVSQARLYIRIQLLQAEADACMSACGKL